MVDHRYRIIALPGEDGPGAVFKDRELRLCHTTAIASADKATLVTMTTSKNAQTEHSGKLRAWYLARLRKSALADRTALMATPATLIDFDQESIKSLIQASAKQADAHGVENWSGGEKRAVLFTAFLSLAAAATVLAIGSL